MSGVVQRAKVLLADPVGLAYRLGAMGGTGSLWSRYGRLSRGAGIAKPYFVLSFDCDTEEDIAVAEPVHRRLRDMGVTPVYAVPGELLKKGEAAYRRILDAGGEFINHGYREHTYFDAARGRHASCFFYDQQTSDAVRRDIEEGDRNLREFFGVMPLGFRTPHFGSYQKPAHLAFLYGVLRKLGYRFSSSTNPVFAFRFGPVFRRHGIVELPVSGMGDRPLRILDSWGCFAAPERRFGPADYQRQGESAARHFAGLGTGILNYYADPSHIHDRPEFFAAVAAWARVARPVTYGQLLAELPA